jgi:hypothetical protein
MKKLLVLLAFLPTILLAQTDSWVRFAVQYDYWAPSESAFTFVSNTNGDTILYHQPTTNWEYLDTIVDCNSGPYIITLNDSYGDGWASYQGGQLMSPYPEFKMSNDCQGMIFYADSTALVGFSVLDTLVNINPCAPPVEGCTDTNATNFNPLATIEDGSCTYPPCGGLIFSNAYQNCQPNGQALAIFEWETQAYNQSCDVVSVWITNENGLGPYEFPGYWPAGGPHNFAFNAGPGQMPPNWNEEFYCQLEFADGSLSDTIAYTPYSCIPGCLDPTQISYNPWATIDDGSCSGTTCDTNTQYQVSLSITLDNWPGETSWDFVDGLGNTFTYPVGTYDFNDIGQTYTYSFCVDQNAAFELIINDDYGDGMAGSTSGGSIDGEAVIYDCSGDTIWYMDNPGFGNVLYSGPQTATPCPTIPVIDGCTDDDYVEFNPAANNDDGSCATLHTYGCTDSTAFNYDPNATMMDLIPDCNYELWIGDAGGDGWGNSFIGVYQNGINLGTYTMGPGNYQQSWNIILDPGVPVEVFYFEVGGPQQPPQEVQFQTWHNSFKLTNADGVVLMHEGQNPFANNGQGALQSFESPFWTKYTGIPFCGNTCVPVVLGCMDSTAANYDPLANVDDNSCIPIIYGCTNIFAINYDPTATVDDNSCIPIVNGCTDSLAYNYNPLANVDDFSCIYLGCTDIIACNYDSIANVDNGGCTYPVQYYDCYGACINDIDGDGVCDELEVLGCTDPLSINFNPLATDDDGSCDPYVYGCTDSTMFNYNPNANTDDGTCIPFIYGCTDPTMFNYDVNANTDDNSCIPVVIGCMDVTMWNYDPNANTPSGNCIPFIYGCTDSTMFNYNPLANTDNGTCEPFIYGCTDPTALNYNQLANTLDNSCCYLGGCTDSTALNYDPDACYDDGTCVVIIEGCADPNAYNYDPLVNLPDNSVCLYDAGCYGGPGNPYWLNDGCYAWVIDVDSYCCTNDWDVSCQSMYDYCTQGWPVSVEETTGSGTILVYPNPTNSYLNIDTRLDVDVEIYDMLGKQMINKENVKRIDISSFPSGIYNMMITYDRMRWNKKIIKE